MKKKAIFTGVATALVTPFYRGEIDYAALSRLIERQISAGIPALVIGGTTGEAATLSERERLALWSFAAERVSGRARLIFGTGTNDTKSTIYYTRHAAAIGCDAALCVTPYYNKGTKRGITEHYLRVADSTDLPIILYNVPSRTGVDLTVSQITELSVCERIVGIKEASDSAEKLAKIAALGDAMPLYAGSDISTYTVLALGGAGVVSVISNIIPGIMREVCERYLAGDITGSRARLLAEEKKISSLFAETNPAPIKYLMGRMGLCHPEIRSPLSLPERATRKMIADVWRLGK